jgi:hypothetical protein
MKTEVGLLKVLRTSPDVSQLLERHFDFVSLPAPTESRLFRLGEKAYYELVGRDKSGGEFALCDNEILPTRPLLYISSEGQAGIIGPSLENGLSMIIDLPYWHDCLKFSGGGQIAEMRRVVSIAEDENLELAPQLCSIRHKLRAWLTLSPLPDPVYALHAAVLKLSPLFPAYAKDGSQFASLFNKFTVMSNPQWRRKLASNE